MLPSDTGASKRDTLHTCCPIIRHTLWILLRVVQSAPPSPPSVRPLVTRRNSDSQIKFMAIPNRNSGIFIRGLTPDDLDLDDDDVYRYDELHGGKRLSGLLKDVPVLELSGPDPDEYHVTKSMDFIYYPDPQPHHDTLNNPSLPRSQSSVPESGFNGAPAAAAAAGNVSRRHSASFQRRSHFRDSVYSTGTTTSLLVEPSVFIKGLSREDITESGLYSHGGPEDSVLMRLQKARLELRQGEDDVNGSRETSRCRCSGSGSCTRGPKTASSVLRHSVLLLSCTLHWFKVGLLTQFQRTFHFSGVQSGLTISAKYMGHLLTLLIVYFSSTKLKPKYETKLLGGSSAAVGISTIVFVIPYFISSHLDPTSDMNINHVPTDTNIIHNTTANGSSFCSFPNATEQLCEDTSATDWDMPLNLTLFCLSWMLHGFGEGYLWIISCLHGISSLTDDVVGRRFKFPAAAFCSAVVAISVGFLLASIFVSGSADATHTLNQPWWLAALALGLVILALGLTLCCLRRTVTIEISGSQDDVTAANHIPESKSTLKTNHSAAISLMSHGLFVLALGAIVLDLNVWSSYFVFLPKLVETQFHRSPQVADWIVALLGVPAILGFTLGVLVIWKFHRLSPWCLLVVLQCCGTLSSFIGLIWVRCDDPMETTFNRNCSSDCACAPPEALPVCSLTGVTYSSPCVAGCQGVDYSEGRNNYTDCKCLETGSAWVLQGACETPCSLIIAHCVVAGLILFLSGSALAPLFAVFKRLLPVDSLHVAAWIVGTVIVLLAGIPGPLLFGYIVDRACARESLHCDGHVTCASYDVTWLRHVFYGATAGTKAAALTLYAALYAIIKPRSGKLKSPRVDSRNKTMH